MLTGCHRGSPFAWGLLELLSGALTVLSGALTAGNLGPLANSLPALPNLRSLPNILAPLLTMMGARSD